MSRGPRTRAAKALISVALGMLALLPATTAAAPKAEVGMRTAGTSARTAATINVNTTADELNADGDCSLREAVQAANADSAVDQCPAGSGGDTITLHPGTYALSLPGAAEDANATGDLDIASDLTINGAGAQSTILDGADLDRVVHVHTGTVEIAGATIQNGSNSGEFVENSGGGILNAGALTLTAVTVTQNEATGERTAAGGIENLRGTLTLERSTVSGNAARNAGGGIVNTGGTLSITNSTISGNSSGGCGGGIRNDGTLTLESSTISDNSASGEGGGGICNPSNPGASLRNTILGNNAPQDCFSNSFVVMDSRGHNLIESLNSPAPGAPPTCNFEGETSSDIIGADPALGPLADNGGPTRTHALLDGSPAIDAGSTACPPPATDQRGFGRPAGTACDIGAFEGGASAPPPPPPSASLEVDSAADAVDASPGDGSCATASGACTLRAAVQEANALANAQTITFSSSLNGQPITLTLGGAGEDAAATGDLDLTGQLTITGNGAHNTIVQGCDAGANPSCTGMDRIVDVQDAATVNLTGTTVRNGHIATPPPFNRSGGGIRVGVRLPWEGGGGRAALTLNQSKVLNNSAVGDGGGILNIGDLTLNNSVVSGNRTDCAGCSNSGGGIMNTIGGSLTATGSTISGNTSVTDAGGGLYNNSGSLVSTIRLSNSTISGNTAVSGGGISANGGTVQLASVTLSGNAATSVGAAILAGPGLGDGVLMVKNTIVANSIGTGNCSGAITSEGYNLSDDGSCSFTAPGDLTGVNPRLAPLADNGGPTNTHALIVGSPAIDAANPSGCTDTAGAPLATDQRGAGFPRVVGPRCDIGAFEGSVPDPSPPPPPNVVINTNDSGPGSLRAAIEFSNATPGPNTVVFAIPLTPPGCNAQWCTIKPASPLPQLTDDATTIDGSTQPDTNPAGPEIFLDGSLQADGQAFAVTSDSNVIAGMAIGNFPYQAILIQSNPFPPPSPLFGNVVRASYIGVDPTGQVAVPNGARLTDRLPGISVIGGVNTQIGGPTAADRNVISGNAREGVDIAGGSTGTLVEGNYIGTDRTGAAAIPNASHGVHFGDYNGPANGNTVRGNLISGNSTAAGVHLVNVSGNVVEGNFIGTNGTGTSALGNSDGIAIVGGAGGHTIGGTSAAARNIISGNGTGVLIRASSSNVVLGNYIGTSAGGDQAVPNTRGGMRVDNASNNTIGGTAAGARNVISGNVGDGITFASGSTGNRVHGNYVGTNAAGTAALGNTRFEPGGGGGFGIIFHHSPNNTIGGTSPDARNVVSGNEQAAIQIGGPGMTSGSAGNVIQGNYIGTDANGTANLGNGGPGVFVWDSGASVGGTGGGAGNTIAFNRGGVVVADPGTGNTIARNSIRDNDGLGIDIGSDGLTQNDPGDGDGGANNRQNFPVITLARPSASGSVRINATYSSAPNTTYRFEWFASSDKDPSGYGEGARFLGSSMAMTDGSGTVTIDTGDSLSGAVTQNDWFTGTATAPDGSTSEFSFAVQMGDPLVVTTTADSGSGSLRNAIQYANSNPGPDTISFNIAGCGPCIIFPQSQLPALTDNGTTIDGSTQPGIGPSGPGISLNGGQAGPANGLQIDSSNNRIHRMGFVSWGSGTPGTGNGVMLTGRDNVVTGSYAGLGLNGTPIPNATTGIGVGQNAGPNRIGGPAAGDRNVISGNAQFGILVLRGADGTVIEGNYVGTNPAGTAAMGNGSTLNTGQAGIHVQSDNVTIRGNLISGNNVPGVGVFNNTTTGLLIQGNLIGTNTAGTDAIGNHDGLVITGFGNTIGGATPGARNVISGNRNVGISGGGSGNTFAGNYIGTNAAGDAPVPNQRGGINLFQPTNAVIRDNLVSGNGNVGVFLFRGGGNRVLANVITRNGSDGLTFFSDSSDNVVQGNRIERNGLRGIAMGGPGNLSNRNLVGGTGAGEGNVISGNANGGIEMNGADNVIQGNLIGTDSSGNAALGNTFAGIAVQQGSTNTLIGGTAPGARNVISGNGGPGIGGGGTGLRVIGNYIGTNAAGDATLGNGAGTQLSGAGHVIRDNVVSANTGPGISASGATNLTIAANKVGTNAAGTAALGNGQQGILLGTNGPQGVTNSTIGGTTAADRNIVSGNGRDGIRLAGPATSANTVRGNYVGVDAAGTAALGNAASGIVVFNIGTDAAQGNLIAENLVSANGSPALQFTGAGVMVRGPGARDNRIQLNNIGTDVNGTPGLGNRLGGVVFDFGAHDNVLGGAAGANLIVSNRGAGVMIGSCGEQTVRNRISQNSIFGNPPGTAPGCGDTEIPAIGLGIDLGEDGVTPNDPGDADTGPNELMNFPVLEQSKAKNKVTHIEGTIDTPNPQTVLIEIFTNGSGADPSGFGEGMTFLGATFARADGTFEVQLPPIPDDTMITATATDAAGNTSEFSRAVPAK